MSSFALNREKFDRLVHYVIATCPDLAKLGTTKLQKIIWKSDTGTYKLEKRPITGAVYKKRQYGPATDELWLGLDRLKKAGMIDYWRDEGFANNRAKDVYKNLAKPDVSFLSDSQKKTVDYWAREICLKHTAESISDETHGFAWDISRMGEVMPLFTVFVDELPEEPDPEALEWANSEVRRLVARGVL